MPTVMSVKASQSRVSIQATQWRRPAASLRKIGNDFWVETTRGAADL